MNLFAEGGPWLPILFFSVLFLVIFRRPLGWLLKLLARSALGLGLEDRMKQPVGLLSGGQRQALTLLMATLVTPKLLLLDEHTAALDPATAEKVLPKPWKTSTPSSTRH